MIGNVQAALLTRQIIPLILAAHFLFACETISSFNSEGKRSVTDIDFGKNQLTSKPLDVNAQGTRAAAFSAALTPLEDIGLRKREIPDMLKMLAENPYTPPTTFTCDEVKNEMTDLNVLLGPDFDEARKAKTALSAQEQMMEDGSNMISDAFVGLVRSQTDIIPLRSIVRRLTGATSHEKKVAQAVEAGKLRRAYLKGLAYAKFNNACIPQPEVITATVEPKKDAEPLEIAKK